MKNYKYNMSGPTATQVMCALLNATTTNDEKNMNKYFEGKITEKEKDMKVFSLYHTNLILDAVKQIFSDWEEIGVWAGLDRNEHTPKDVQKFLENDTETSKVVPLKGIIK